MVASRISTIITAVRVCLVIVGAIFTALTVLYLASMPSPPPGSDGFAHGMAGFFGGVIILASLSLATLSIILPTLLGLDDPLGFNARQRLALKGVGGVMGLGIAISIVFGLTGVVLLILLLVLGFGVVCSILGWRFIEFLGDRRTREKGTG